MMPESEFQFELPGFQFLEELGRGTSGIVYQALQQSLHRLVAVKILTTPATDEKRLARQRQEAQILAHLKHPNVVQIHEVVFHKGVFYLVMELIVGSTLSDRAKDRLFSAREAAQLICTLAEAVQAVHEAGILHRDLKPSNVIITEAGEPKITDFGLAKQRSNTNLLTTQDSILGTPSYMAPEQAVGDVASIGVESDVYSLGAILYELLTGRPPFLGATVLDTLSQIRNRDPVPPRHFQPQIPRDLETICLKCLNKSPSQRYVTSQALAEDLRAFVQGSAILARRATAIERMLRFVKRRPTISIAIASLVLLVAVATGFAWTVHEQRRQLGAAALVESIAAADPQVLPELLGRLPSQQPMALSQIRAALTAVVPADTKWVNLSVAELEADPGASPKPLLAYLPTARPAEVSLIVPRLAAHAADLQPALWPLLLDPGATPDARLRLACLAARISPEDPRWSVISGDVVTALVRQHPFELGSFIAALEPARTALIPALVNLSGKSKMDAISRHTAVVLLAQFAADQPEILVNLVLIAEPDEFRLLIPTLKQHTNRVSSLLKSVADRSMTVAEIWKLPAVRIKHDVESTYDAVQHNRANALITMWELGNPDAAREALRRNSEPALRAWLIELVAPSGVPHEALREMLCHTHDDGVREAIVLALGQASLSAVKTADREALVADLLSIYQNDPDAGVHSACRWLLETGLDCNTAVEKIDDSMQGKLDRAQGWYVGPNRHIFSVFRGPMSFTMGSPPDELSRESDEISYQAQIDHSFAIASTEVTNAQFRRFRENADINTQYSPTDDCPANDISWFEAAAYCRWLSEQARLPETEMCYPPIAEIKPGMHLPPDWMKRTGYRLPTTEEWEYACRGGVSASRPCGEGGQLLSNYAWYLNNSEEHAWPVGHLKPNEFGLFDMLGNVLERCQSIKTKDFSNTSLLIVANPSIKESDRTLVIDGNAESELRGGSFGDPNQNVRSARRCSNATSDKWASVGFRVARSL
jgi:formylglycine-generating enzyme required for sulfatase activity/tRNA A-37 threonylcarbamoyl transferase component Bud32